MDFLKYGTMIKEYAIMKAKVILDLLLK